MSIGIKDYSISNEQFFCNNWLLLYNIDFKDLEVIDKYGSY